MWPKSGVWDPKKFNSKNFSTVRKQQQIFLRHEKSKIRFNQLSDITTSGVSGSGGKAELPSLRRRNIGRWILAKTLQHSQCSRYGCWQLKSADTAKQQRQRAAAMRRDIALQQYVAAARRRAAAAACLCGSWLASPFSSRASSPCPLY